MIGGEDRVPYVYLMDRPRNMKVGEEATLVRMLERQDGAIFALDWSPDGKADRRGRSRRECESLRRRYRSADGFLQGPFRGDLFGGVLPGQRPPGNRRVRRPGEAVSQR